MSRLQTLSMLTAGALLATASTGRGQNLSGALSDSTTGPVTPGVHVVTGPISVQVGQTLTIQAGAILKFPNGGIFGIDGTLLVPGEAGNEVIFTDYRDDSAGGDTNANGPSSGAPGWWCGLIFGDASDASALSRFEVRYAGYANYPGVTLSASDASFAEGTVRHGLRGGLHGGNNSFPSVTSCSFQSNGAAAISGIHIDAVPGFHGNTAGGNTLDQLQVNSGTVAAASTVIGPANGINGVVCLQSMLSVPSGKLLTLQAGTVLKMFNGTYVNVDGTLVTQGASGNPVVFTDYRDDSIGGDSNGDGASSGTPGGWYGLMFNDGSDASSLDRFEVRYAGYANYPALSLSGCNASFTNGLVENGLRSGLSGSNTSYPTVVGCTFRDNGAAAIMGVHIDAVPGFSNNTASGNAADQLQVNVGTLAAASTTIGPSNGIGGTIYLPVALSVPAGKALTLQAGTKVKFGNGSYVSVDGSLVTQGASTAPVIFSDYRDDSAGGDTNGDGPSSGSPGWWYGLAFNSTSGASSLDYFEVRFAGYANSPAIRVVDADVELRRGIVRDGLRAGIDLAGSSARPVINRCLIQQNGAAAISGASINAVPYITKNSATGNTFNHLLVTNTTVASDLYIDGNAGVNGVSVLAHPLVVPVGKRLTLGPGAAFKMSNGGYVGVDGELEVKATAIAPAVFTDYRDDSIAGDSNGDGPSSGAPGWWYGVYVYSGAGATTIENVLVRYGGYANTPSLTASSASVSLLACRVESGLRVGFALQSAARADGLVAIGCGNAGIQLDSGSFDLRHATVHACAQGIARNGSAFSGAIVDSIAWGNTTNWVNVPVGQVRYSCGYTGGGTGNVDVDPLFVDAATGDLRLAASSPCIDSGDPLSEGDPDCTRSDMGAYPCTSLDAPTVYCVGKPNSAGCTPFLACSGIASASSSQPFSVRAFNVVNGKYGLFFYGVNGRLNAPFQGGTKCVANPVKRLPILASGGNVGVNDCSGRYEVDFNALIRSGLDPLLVPGVTVDLQCWYRDPIVVSKTGLSGGLEFHVCN